MITSGFFPSVNGDRKQTDSFLAKWVHSFISNGIYNGDFAVTAGENMNVILPVGQAWIGGYYCRNDGNITLPIANADGVLKRKDTVVLRWDINTRDITVQVLTGVFASNPVAPAIVRNAEQYDLKLAEISIAAGAISITQSAITDTRLDNNVCGIVHAVVDHIDTTTLFNQLQAYMVEHEAQFTADMAAFKTQSGADFSTWFNGIKDVLGKDEAGNLLNLINSHTANTAIHVTQTEKDKITHARPDTWVPTAADVGAVAVTALQQLSNPTSPIDIRAYVASLKSQYARFLFNSIQCPNFTNIPVGGVAIISVDGIVANGSYFATVTFTTITNDHNSIYSCTIYDNTAYTNWQNCLALVKGEVKFRDTISGTEYMIYSTANTGSAVPTTSPALRNITMSTSAPSGGSSGDVWHQYV